MVLYDSLAIVINSLWPLSTHERFRLIVYWWVSVLHRLCRSNSENSLSYPKTVAHTHAYTRTERLARLNKPPDQHHQITNRNWMGKLSQHSRNAYTLTARKNTSATNARRRRVKHSEKKKTQHSRSGEQQTHISAVFLQHAHGSSAARIGFIERDDSTFATCFREHRIVSSIHVYVCVRYGLYGLIVCIIHNVCVLNVIVCVLQRIFYSMLVLL